MRLKSEKVRKDKLAHLEKEIRKLEERFPHFPRWLELLKQHSDQPLERLGSWDGWREWPEAFYRATGVAVPFKGRKLSLPHEYAFFCYVEAQAAREKVAEARLGKTKGAVPRPNPVHDTPKHEPKRRPRW